MGAAEGMRPRCDGGTRFSGSVGGMGWPWVGDMVCVCVRTIAFGSKPRPVTTQVPARTIAIPGKRTREVGLNFFLFFFHSASSHHHTTLQVYPCFLTYFRCSPASFSCLPLFSHASTRRQGCAHMERCLWLLCCWR